MLMEMDNPICDVILNSLGNYVYPTLLIQKLLLQITQIGRTVVVPCKIT
jgi:hypothetical protein